MGLEFGNESRMAPTVPALDGSTWLRDKNRQPYNAQGRADGPGGVLLIHGFTGSPGELRPLGEWLTDLGYAVEIPVLAGHCTDVRDLNRVRYREWLISGEQAYQRLSRDVHRMWVLGHSMGGLVAFHLANRFPVAGVISTCAPVHVVNPYAWLANVVGFAVPVIKGRETRQLQVEPYLGGYSTMPVRAITQFLQLLRRSRQEIAALQTPLLIQQARLDMTVRPDSADYLYRNAGSEHKRIKWYERSGHMLPVDVDQEQVWTDILAFLQETERGFMD